MQLVAAFLSSNIVGITGLIMAIIAVTRIRGDRQKLSAETYRTGVDSVQIMTNTALSLVEVFRTASMTAQAQAEGFQRESITARAEAEASRAEAERLRAQLALLRGE